jgi:hypothetical protein
MGALGIGTDSRFACDILEPGQPNSSPETTLYAFSMLIQDLKVHVFVAPSSEAYHPS